MNGDVIVLSLATGAATWAFRALPMMLARKSPRAGGLGERFLAATGPAAIATLFVATMLPLARGMAPLPLLAGCVAVMAVFAASRSVVLATLAGAAACGLTVALG